MRVHYDSILAMVAIIIGSVHVQWLCGRDKVYVDVSGEVKVNWVVHLCVTNDKRLLTFTR